MNMPSYRRILVLVLIVSLLGGVATSVRAASGDSANAGFPAAIWVVTSTDDSGPGTLRQAIAGAAPGDVIVFDAGLGGATITLTSGELLIDKDLTIDATATPGVNLSGGQAVRVLHVSAAAVVTLRNLVIGKGATPNAPPGASATGGGGIFNEGRLLLWGCLVVGNRTGDGGDVYQDSSGLWQPAGSGGHGAGIYNTGNLEVRSSSVDANSTGNGGNKCVECPILLFQGGHGGSGGGIYSTGVLTVSHSLVSENDTGDAGRGMPFGHGGDGAGLYSAGRATVDATYFSLNSAGAGSNACSIAAFPDTRDCAGGSGGGLYVTGTLTMTDSLLIGNWAGEGSPGGNGGGLAATGAIYVSGATFDDNKTGDGVTILDNSASDQGRRGGNSGNGGGVSVTGGAFTLENSRLVNNRTGNGGGGGNTARSGGAGGSAGSGAGLYVVSSSPLSIVNSTVNGNRGGTGGDGGYGGNRCGDGGDGGNGGGAWLNVASNVESSTFSGNIAGNGGLSCDNTRNAAEHGRGGHGGGIYKAYDSLTITNTTISGNSAGHGAGDLGVGGSGGGIYIIDVTVLRNSTIVGNHTPPGGNGGGVWNDQSYFLVNDTLLANNDAGGSGPDCSGHFLSVGYNLIQNSTGCYVYGDPTGNIFDRPALIGPLALNAPGTTETHALLPDSPAVDAGSCSEGAVATDQRGVSRPQGSACDIGAYERAESAELPLLIYLPLIRGMGS